MTATPLIEPTHIQDVFVSGIAEIEGLGTCARLVLYVDSSALGIHERLVVTKLVIPVDALPEIIRQMLAFAVNNALPAIAEGMATLIH